MKLLITVTDILRHPRLDSKERVMRTLEKTDTPILSGMRIYHNFVKPHRALDGKTPAEMAGIQV